MPEHPSAPVGPVDGRQVPRFAGAGSFARLPEIDRVPDYDVAILGVPFDSGTSYRPGARFGPMAVRQASRHLRPGHHVELDCAPFHDIQVVDAGDVPVTPFSIDAAMQQVQQAFGSFPQYLDAVKANGEEALLKDLRKRFAFLGETTSIMFLFGVGEEMLQTLQKMQERHGSTR